MFFKEVTVDFDFEKIIKADYSEAYSCIKHQVHELQDIHEQFGGFPKSYCFENTIIYQLWWDKSQVDYELLGKQLNMEVISVSSIKQPPGCVVPYHRDTFYKIKSEYPDRTDVTVRANIYLEDYKLGQMIQYVIGDNINTSVNWKAGTGFIWDKEVLHLSCNAGMQDKYTLQVSGFLLNH